MAAVRGSRRAAPVGVAAGVADELRERTRELHARAESAGVVSALLSGTVSRGAYLSYLRNLHVVYESLEQELRRRSREPRWLTIAAPQIYRAAAIAADLDAIDGPEWRVRYRPTAATERYRERIRAVGANGARLAAHAYTRYLGDLSGGRILAQIAARALALAPEQLRTYRFDEIEDLACFKARYRAAFDAWHYAESVLLDETIAAFELNIELAEEVAVDAR